MTTTATQSWLRDPRTQLRNISCPAARAIDDGAPSARDASCGSTPLDAGCTNIPSDSSRSRAICASDPSCPAKRAGARGDSPTEHPCAVARHAEATLAATTARFAMSQRRVHVASDTESCRTVVALCGGIERCNNRYYSGSTTGWSRGSRSRMLRFCNATLLALGVIGGVAHAQERPPTSVRAHAVRRAGDIAIDGRLDEAAWTAAPKH